MKTIWRDIKSTNVQINSKGEYRFRRKDKAWQMTAPGKRDVKADLALYFPEGEEETKPEAPVESSTEPEKPESNPKK